ncbi:MAG: hypothetical protein MRJ92_08145 [Nitrospira sp.]|nr:hypothetical protein [Nitrospira sp.]
MADVVSALLGGAGSICADPVLHRKMWGWVLFCLAAGGLVGIGLWQIVCSPWYGWRRFY